MDSRRTYFAMIGVFVLLISLLGATVFMGNSYLKKQSDKLVSAKLDRLSLNEQQTALIKAKKDLEKYHELRSIARSIVPQDKDQAKAVREIVELANSSGVTLESITFDDSTLGQASAAPAPRQTGQEQVASPKSEAPPITQAKPVEGISGVYSLPITMVSTKNNNQFSNLLTFLGKLENNRRTAHVEKVSITPGDLNGKEYINFTLTVNIFVKP